MQSRGGGTHRTCSGQSRASPATDRPSLFENPAPLSSGFRVHVQRLTRGELRPSATPPVPVSSSCSSGGRWGLGPSGLGPQLELSPVQEAPCPRVSLEKAHRVPARVEALRTADHQSHKPHSKSFFLDFTPPEGSS